MKEQYTFFISIISVASEFLVSSRLIGESFKCLEEALYSLG